MTPKIERLGWELLPHPPYSPDLAPSDYYLFRSMQDHLTGQQFTSIEEIKNWIDVFITSKSVSFFRDGICELPELWGKCVAADGQYFILKNLYSFFKINV